MDVASSPGELADGSSQLSSKPSARSKTQEHLKYLDGMRGLCAFYVVLTHVYQIFGSHRPNDLPLIFRIEARLTEYGWYAVAIFIVLSGYCLMMPVAKSQNCHLRGGIPHYLFRRARRILPPYYAALLISIALILGENSLLHAKAAAAGIKDQVSSLTPGVIISHLLLIHNLLPWWAMKINSPMWSVATEWQIYFFFPLLLLPIWKRFGNIAAILVGLAVGLLPHIFSHVLWKHCAPFYLGLFGIGMSGAAVGFSTKQAHRMLLDKFPWVACSVVCALLWLGYVAAKHTIGSAAQVALSILVAVAATCMMVKCTDLILQAKPNRPWIYRMFASKPLVVLGSFSYSLYLIHVPILQLTNLLLLSMNMVPASRYGLLLVVGTSASLAVAYIFHLLFEKPFMTSK